MLHLHELLYRINVYLKGIIRPSVHFCVVVILANICILPCCSIIGNVSKAELFFPFFFVKNCT